MSSLTRNSTRLFRILSLLCVSAMALSCAPKLIVQDSVSGEEISFTVESGSDLETMDTGIGQYDFQLKAGRHEISGFLVARNVFEHPDGSGKRGVRVVASTYFGMRLFDITVMPDSHVMNSCVEFLDGKAVSSFLASRLRKKYL